MDTLECKKKGEKPMVEWLYALKKRERATNAAQRQQESERRVIGASRIGGSASEFHWATFYREDTELK